MTRWLTLTQLPLVFLVFLAGCYSSGDAPPPPRVAIDGCTGEGETHACSFELVIDAVDSIDAGATEPASPFEGRRLHLYAQGSDSPASLVILEGGGYFHNGGRDVEGPDGVFEVDAYEPGPLLVEDDGTSLTIYSLGFDDDLAPGATGSMSGRHSPDGPVSVRFHLEADVDPPRLDASEPIVGRTATGRVLPWEGLTVSSTEPIAGPDVRATADLGVPFSEPFSGSSQVGLTPEGWWPSAESAAIEIEVSDPSGNTSEIASLTLPLIPYSAPTTRVDFNDDDDLVFSWGDVAPSAGDCAEGGCLALSLSAPSSGFFVVVGGDSPVQTVTFSARLIAPAGSVDDGDAGAILAWLVAARDDAPDSGIWPEPTQELSAAPGERTYDSGYSTVRIDLPAPTTATGVLIQLRNVPLTARNPTDGVVLIDDLRAE